MRIKSITIHGFRGFNDSQKIEFNERLTLISASNSYGKTSISEAFEWLIYGSTSKVEQADSKDEYKGSYHNTHLTAGMNPSITLVLDDSGHETILHAELVGEGIKRLINGAEVKEWPFASKMADIPKPFILQHALKNLLLAAPVERFKGFAHLLGFTELGDIHRDLLSLCTKPPLPKPIQELVGEITSLQSKLDSRTQFQRIAKLFKKGRGEFDSTYSLIKQEAFKYVPKGTEETALIPRLLQVRDEAVAKVFQGNVTLENFSEEELRKNSEDEQFLITAVTKELIANYVSLASLKTVENIKQLAELHELSVKILIQDPGKCPVCKQPLDQTTTQSISDSHTYLTSQCRAFADVETRKNQVSSTLNQIRSRLQVFHTRCTSKILLLLKLRPDLIKIEKLLLPNNAAHHASIVLAMAELEAALTAFNKSNSPLQEAINSAETSLKNNEEKQEVIEQLGTRIIEYMAAAAQLKKGITTHATAVQEAGKILQHELDTLAGMQDVALFVELLERQKDVYKKFKVDEVIEGLKRLRAQVDTYVSKTMLDAISNELTAEVMYWYDQIRTTGDPNVHFSGFDMKKTAQGGRVQIKASSYGKDLVSAVSSLSESKLNALGLCINIAINIRTTGPFEFLIIDDPIQSWDAEHETKFIEVVKELVKRGKQVVLLSHNDRWIRQVRTMCAEVNGSCYEITAYTDQGPRISMVHWMEIDQRLTILNGILADSSSDKIRLQQAEQEVRHIITQLACDLYLRTTGTKKSPHSVNSEETRKMLLASGVDNDLVNKLVSTFTTVDDAHHSSPNYAAHRERIKTYHGWITTLKDAAAKKAKAK